MVSRPSSPHRRQKQENRVICVIKRWKQNGQCSRAGEFNKLPDRWICSQGGFQCFPFYTYNEDGDKPPGEYHRLGISTIPGHITGTR